MPAEMQMQAQPPTSEPIQQVTEGRVEEGKKESSSWLNKVKNAMPIRSVSDEEYESKLKERLSGVNQRMADVEKEIREIEGLIKQQEENAASSN